MKKFKLVAFTALTLLGLVSCGNDKEDNKDNNTTTQTTTEHQHDTSTSSEHVHNTSTSSEHDHNTSTTSEHDHNTSTTSEHIHNTTTSSDVDNEEEIIDLSSPSFDFEKEYFYSDYNAKSLADTSRQGIKTFENKDDIVFDAVTYEQLVDIFESEGNYLILFGGSWCHNTRAAVPFINEFANQYGISTIYNFDFYLDGSNSSTHIRNTNPSDPARANAGQQYNYLYGELISKYLTNLTDYVEYKTGTGSSLNYTNKDSAVVNVAKAQVPFLFLYNKDNKVDNSGIDAGGTSNSKGTYPIVYGFEEMIDLDAQGVYKTVQGQRQHDTDSYKNRLKGIFDYIDENDIELSYYEDADYIEKFYNQKSGQTIFEDEQINIKTLTYRQLIWLLGQEGNSLIYLGGTWCGNTQASIKTTNDYAVKNDVIIYNFDTKLDGGYVKANWGYANDLHIRDSQSPFVNLYADLIEKYFTNIVTLYNVNDSESYKFIQYTDKAGNVVKVKKLQVPYLLSYNKDAKDNDGFSAPITSYYEEMLYLNETSDKYVYSETNYASIKSHTKNVINTYLQLSQNKEAKDI